jgi:hypothetical protein
MEKKDCRIYDSCDDKQHIFGTGFTVSKWWRSRESDFKPTDRRTCVLRIRGKFKNWSFICTNAPMEEKCERQEEEFVTD